MDTIDLRSDTVSWPTPKMREAMANALVGDDVYGEDPTVNQLEHNAAELLGKEAGLFVSSGTQGNLISFLAHCPQRGSEIILGDISHGFISEAGGTAAIGGIHPRTVPVQPDATLRLEDIKRAIRRTDDYHFPLTRLITLENTHNSAGGVAIPKIYIDQVAELAHKHNLKLHIDGARIFNAAASFNIPAKDLVENANTLTFCLSKGLCAPAGSVIVGNADFIAKARRIRKVLGGGMRQAGILAAAGLVAIHEMVDRLHQDHETACQLGEGLAKLPYTKVISINTNFVFFDITPEANISPSELVKHLYNDYKIRISRYGSEGRFRLRTHYWITPDRVQEVINAMRECLS